MGGIMAVTGPVGGPASRVGVAISDLASGLFVANGVLAALIERTTTGLGRHVEVCLLDSQVALLVNLASAWLNGGVATGSYGNAHPNIAPYESFATADHPIVLAVGTDRQFRRLAAVLGRPSMGDDPRFATNRDRVVNRVELRLQVESALALQSRDTWLSTLNAAEVPAAAVNSIPEVFADPVVSERMVAEVDGVAQLRSPIRLDGACLAVTGSPPTLGQHTDEILAAMGISQARIAHLRRQGAC
jgi:crotonobetainyl-CoA:carnitine CoA-transferase CaiB-like acyl-CoA transferase